GAVPTGERSQLRQPDLVQRRRFLEPPQRRDRPRPDQRRPVRRDHRTVKTMDAIVLRSLERLVVVAFGGLSIYLGYRLFLRMPDQENAQGRVTLPGGISIFLCSVRRRRPLAVVSSYDLVHGNAARR